MINKIRSNNCSSYEARTILLARIISVNGCRHWPGCEKRSSGVELQGKSEICTHISMNEFSDTNYIVFLDTDSPKWIQVRAAGGRSALSFIAFRWPSSSLRQYRLSSQKSPEFSQFFLWAISTTKLYLLRQRVILQSTWHWVRHSWSSIWLAQIMHCSLHRKIYWIIVTEIR